MGMGYGDIVDNEGLERFWEKGDGGAKGAESEHESGMGSLLATYMRST
jgi:hypothetical protein